MHSKKAGSRGDEEFNGLLFKLLPGGDVYGRHCLAAILRVPGVVIEPENKDMFGF